MISKDEISVRFPMLSGVIDFRSGGQKRVFRATHAEYGDVALKFISPQTQFERVEREIEVVKRLNIENVPKIYETGYAELAGEKMFFMLEHFVDGMTLREKYANSETCPRMSKEEAVGLLRAMLDVIVQLEQGHVIHRDIKPENILVGSDRKYWLIDFGAARDMDGSTLTLTGKCAPMTPGYAAPEQFKFELRKQLDSRADLFALGVTVYELLSGQHPFYHTGYGLYDVLRSTVTMTADTLDIPGDERGELAGFIKTLMQKNPAFRPPTAQWAKLIFEGLQI